jgi:hypothetical protein
MRTSCRGCNKPWNPAMMGAPNPTPAAPLAPISSQGSRSYSQMSQGRGKLRGGRFTTHGQAMEARRRGMFISTCALVAVALIALYLWKR